MKLTVLVPSRVLVRETVSEVVAEGREGSFGILPRHVDYVSPLVPGILMYRQQGGGAERILAVDQGVLVKVGDEVLVSVRDAIPGEDLGTLRSAVDETFRTLDEREHLARSALASLEARFIRRFVEEFGRARG